MPEREKDDDFRFEILEHIGVVGKYQTGWSKEINIVSWRGGSPKLDIRDWDPSHERMSRGVTMHKNEVLTTMQILMEHYGDDFKQLGENSGAEKQENESVAAINPEPMAAVMSTAEAGF